MAPPILNDSWPNNQKVQFWRDTLGQ